MCLSNPFDSQQGIALLIVLVFMQIFALLGLYSISESILLQKMSESEFAIFPSDHSENGQASQADIKGKYNPNCIGR